MPEDFALQALRMVERQLRGRGMRDEAVLAAMLAVPRHRFVRPVDRAAAYSDRALPNAEGQTISQPYIVARMTEMLGVTEQGCRVLEIGTGTGYQTAVLAQLGAQVVTIESHDRLAEAARATLAELGYASRVTVRIGDGTEGCPDLAPFDRIIVTAAAPSLPPPLREQLADPGCIVIPIGDPYQQCLCRIVREAGQWREHRGEGCVFVPLVGRYGWSQ